MAYIDTATVKTIRQALKNEFPNIKFSVRKFDHTSVRVAIVKSPIFDDGVDEQVNQYWIDRDIRFTYYQRQVLKRVDEIIRVSGEHFDDSDSMTDYFHCAFYYDISVGLFDKPHEKTS